MYELENEHNTGPFNRMNIKICDLFVHKKKKTWTKAKRGIHSRGQLKGMHESGKG